MTRSLHDSVSPLRGVRRLLSLAVAGLLLVGLTVPGTLVQAQDDGAKPTLDEADYGKWEDIGDVAMSPEGTWMAVRIERVNGNHELRVHHTQQDSVVTVDFGNEASFSADGQWLAYAIGMSEEKEETLRKKDQPVREKLGLLNLATGDTTVVPSVSGFAWSDDGRYLAMKRYPPAEASDEMRGADVVVRDLQGESYTRFGNVAEMAWQDDGPLLAMTIDGQTAEGNGIQLYDASTGRLQTLASTPGEYTGLTWRPGGTDLAALRVRSSDDWEEDTHVVLAWQSLGDGAPQPQTFDPAEARSFPDTLRIVDYRALEWSAPGDRLFFGIQSRTPVDTTESDDAGDAEADSTLKQYDPADVQVWHTSDVDIIPRQKVRSKADAQDNFLAAWHLGTGGADGGEARWTRLGTELTEDVRVLHGGNRALGLDQTPYRQERMFGPEYHDLYVIDVASGERERVAQKVQYIEGGSPNGRYVTWLKDDQYHAYNVEQKRTATLDVPVSVVDTDVDLTIEQKPPFGIAGWTAGDRSVLVYSEYDVWQVQPDGSGARRLTTGRADSVRHRYVDLTDEDPGQPDIIPTDAPVYWDVYDEWTEEHGYARSPRIGDAQTETTADVERLVWQEAYVGALMKADSAGVYAYSVEDFEDSPDYLRAGPDLADARQVTATNPFLDDYAWGRSELVAYENRQGEPLQGALFYPANYDPEKSYPMITYIYETRSPSARYFVEPTRTHPYNTTVFTQEGYFVFQPDIVYRPRNPGLSAVDAIVPAVEKVIATTPVDSNRVGLVGHSWGAYQTTFAVTQTDVFASAVAGAPLTNLVSMYHSIYWRSGGTDARIFEISQGRMEVPPYEDMDAYVANSPLHHVTKMTTPLLMAHGTDDGAVEFNQGVEFYNAARRAGKELAFLVYDDENHGLRKKEKNIVDYRTRVLEWFNHYLNGEDGPDWITEGTSYLDQMEKRKEAKNGEDGQ